MIRLWLMAVGVVLLLGCGVSDPLNDLLDPGDSPVLEGVAVKNGKDGIHVLENEGTVRYLGEIENHTAQPTCFVDISFSTYDAEGGLIDQGFGRAEIVGTTLRFFDQIEHACLLSGEFASFDTGELDVSAPFDDFLYKICVNPNLPNDPEPMCDFFPLAEEPLAVLTLLDLEAGEIGGMRAFTFRVRNDSEMLAHDAKVYFTVLDAEGRVMEIAGSVTLPGQPCAEDLGAAHPTSCLSSGVITPSLTVQTSTPVGETCAGCFYYRVHHSE